VGSSTADVKGDAAEKTNGDFGGGKPGSGLDSDLEREEIRKKAHKKKNSTGSVSMGRVGGENCVRGKKFKHSMNRRTDERRKKTKGLVVATEARGCWDNPLWGAARRGIVLPRNASAAFEG